MTTNLKCFISVPYGTDTQTLKEILTRNGVDVSDLYDFSIGESIQQILKQKIRQSDFAIFILSKENPNIMYEIGICEGLGKQHFILIEEDLKTPFYLESKLLLRVRLLEESFMRMTIEKILQDVKKKRIKLTIRTKEDSKKKSGYNQATRDKLNLLLFQIKDLRKSGRGEKLEELAGDVFKAINLNYAGNTAGSDKGVDFALWNDELGKIVGNPIIVEIKHGRLSQQAIDCAESNIRKYAGETGAKVALLLYLDKEGRKYEARSTINPLVIFYDIEDFVRDIIDTSFERFILSQRNNIAHGVK